MPVVVVMIVMIVMIVVAQAFLLIFAIHGSVDINK